MKRMTISLLLALLPAAAGAAPQGAALHAEHCVSCHDSDVYTRAERMVKERDALTKQVRRCQLALGLQWFDEEVQAVADYLNSAYYHF